MWIFYYDPPLVKKIKKRMGKNKIMDKRRSALCGFDLLILALSYSIILFCSLNSSLTLNGEPALQTFISRFFFLAICIIGFRICFKIYNHIWRYAGIKVYLRLVVSDFIAGLEILLIGQFDSISWLRFWNQFMCHFFELSCLSVGAYAISITLCPP